MQTILFVKEGNSLTPADINLSNYLCNTFGKAETEQSAVHLIEYLQEIHSEKWHFKLSGLLDFYKRKGLKQDEALYGLFGSWFDDGGTMCVRQDPGYIINWGYGLQVTQDFLERIQKHAILQPGH